MPMVGVGLVAVVGGMTYYKYTALKKDMKGKAHDMKETVSVAVSVAKEKAKEVKEKLPAVVAEKLEGKAAEWSTEANEEKTGMIDKVRKLRRKVSTMAGKGDGLLEEHEIEAAVVEEEHAVDATTTKSSSQFKEKVSVVADEMEEKAIAKIEEFFNCVTKPKDEERDEDMTNDADVPSTGGDIE